MRPTGLGYRASKEFAIRDLSTGPHPPVQFWISELICDQGREKFEKFWKSGTTFEQAFHDAFGEDLGSWTMHWAVRQWENS